MKFYKSICAGLCMLSYGLHATAQQDLSVQVEKQLSVQQAVNYSLFSVSDKRSELIDKGIQRVTYLSLDRAELKKLTADNEGLISFTLPLQDGQSISLQLMRYDFRTKDYRTVVKTASGYTTVASPDGDFYRGSIKGIRKSMAAFSFYEDEIGAVFADESKGNYNLVLNKENPGINNENYILYREDDIVDKSKRGHCGITDDMAKLSGPGPDGGTSDKGIFETNCKTARISVFADYLLYQRCTSSVVKSVQYMNTLFNVISALYANDRLFLNLSETIVATVSEGYTYSGSDEVLFRFGNLVQSYTYNGDIAHMMTGYSSSGYPPLGGLAWLNVMCQAATPVTLGGAGTTYYGPYSMGNVYVSATIPSLPTYSWDVQVTAHELGHNIGSPHTQSCTWAGGPIDGCVDPEDGCTTVAPIPSSGGTIMSYCHLKSGVGINFANGFGPLPKALLNSKISTASCLSSGLSDSTLRLASKTIVANAECNDGVWTHYFFDNNTSDLSDDIMLLSVKKGTLDIGNTANPTFLIKMITNGFYGKDTVAKLSVGYADTNWYEINRRWTIQLPSGKQPTTAVTVRYPFLNQDVKDISKVLLPKVIKDTNLVFLKYANYTPVTSLPAATVADVRRLNNSISAASAKTWYSGVMGTYKYAEIVSDSGLYGGSLGYQIPAAIPPKPSGITESMMNQKVSVRPNPASNTITIDAPAGYSGMQQIMIYDNLGRVLYQQQAPFVDGQLSIDVSGFSTGVYTLRCLGLQSSLNGIFIKQ